MVQMLLIDKEPKVAKREKTFPINSVQVKFCCSWGEWPRESKREVLVT